MAREIQYLEYTYPEAEIVDGAQFDGSLSRESGETTGESYEINIGDLSLGDNYDLTCTPNISFLIKGVSIDASASSKAVQLNTAPNEAVLSALVTNSSNDSISDVLVTFTVQGLTPVTGITDSHGIATATINTNTLLLGVYAVEAVPGDGCTVGYGYLTMYDPNANFVTGGGWIYSLPGAYRTDVSLEGKANFGFVSKYKKGSNQVDGNTEFQFKAGDFNFKSSSHDPGTLVISGAKATYRGVGTVNGTGEYGFMIVAFDGDINTDDSFTADEFRIKIWNTMNGNTTVYDNKFGYLENDTVATELGGGSIVIHNTKEKVVTTGKKSAEIETTIVPVAEFSNLKVYPNPFNDRLKFEFVSPEAVHALIELFDMTGRKVETIFNSDIEGGVTYNAEFKPGNVSQRHVLLPHDPWQRGNER